MKFNHALAAAVVATVGLTTPVMAQEVASQASRDTHFDGLYVGGSFGGALNDVRRGGGLEFDTNRNGSFDDTVRTSTGVNAFGPGFCEGRANSSVPSGGCRPSKDGIEYAGRIGLDKRVGQNVVVGVLGEVSKNEARQSFSGFSTTPASYTIDRQLDYAFSARGRIGYTPNGGILFYGTGGGSYARINHTFSTTNAANSFAGFRDKKMVWGWQAGGGAEIMVTNHVSLGLEYLFNHYKDDKYYVGVGQGSAAATNPFLLNGGGTNLRTAYQRMKFHTMRATLNFQF